MEKQIRQLFAKVLQIPESIALDNSTPETIKQWDSINHLSLIATFEEHFTLNIEPEEISTMQKSYQNFKTIILEKLS